MLGRAPGMKFFWIVRHPLDAICSLRVGIDKDWEHHPRPPDWPDWLDRPLVERCAYHWAFINSIGFAQVSRIATVVRFEDMISNPGAFSQSICHSLGLDYLERGAELKQWVLRVQDENNEHFIEARTSRAYSRTDHSVRIGRWGENLSEKEVDSVSPIIAETSKAFGYTL